MEPLIRSRLDTDLYQFTMGQLAFNRYHGVTVTYALTNRTKGVRLADRIDLDELRFELDCARRLQFTKKELNFLRNMDGYRGKLFSEKYISFLASSKVPPYQLDIVDGDIRFEYSGKWDEAIYVETPYLSILTELNGRYLMRNMSKFERQCIFAEGQLRLAEKIKKLKPHPDATISDFGARRRFSFGVQDYVLETLISELPPSQFLGTSNVYLAKKYGVKAIGTDAHQRTQVIAGLQGFEDSDKGVLTATDTALDEWWAQYGWGLSIALTDTFGTGHFFSRMTEEQARNWKGLRHDSGDPIAFGEKAIKFYQGYGIDPREKLIVFSDGLDVDTIIKLADHFRGRIKCTFGWGTNLTNDLGFPALSLVIKAVSANGQPLVKLSDNLAKAIGVPSEVERYKRICGYTNIDSTECRY